MEVTPCGVRKPDERIGVHRVASTDSRRAQKSENDGPTVAAIHHDVEPIGVVRRDRSDGASTDGTNRGRCSPGESDIDTPMNKVTTALFVEHVQDRRPISHGQHELARELFGGRQFDSRHDRRHRTFERTLGARKRAEQCRGSRIS